MTESEVMQRQQMLANDLWQKLISIDEFMAAMDKLNVETDNFEGGAQMSNQPQNYAAESEFADLRRRAGITEVAYTNRPGGPVIDKESGLSMGAKQVVSRTLDTVQDLDEMGGSDSRSDYIKAMGILIQELTKRRDTAAHLLRTDGENEG